MKTRYWLLICLLCLGVGAGGYAIIDYKFFPCPEADDFSVTQGEEHDPEPRPGVPDPYVGGKTLKIEGEHLDQETLRVKAWTDYLSNYRDFHLDFTCPYIPKWTLGIGILGGVGYMKEINKFDAVIGGEIELFRHFKWLSVGGGIWYTQGVLTDYKAGGLKANIQFSWGKQ